MTDTYDAADSDPSSIDDGSEDWADTPSAYAINPPDSTADDGSDDWPETPSPWPPGALSYPDAPDPTASPTQNPWIMPQVGILDPDAEAQLSAFQNRMNGVQQLLSQLYPMTNGPSTLTGDPTTDLINDPLYHDPSDYDDDGVFYADPNYGGASSGPPSAVNLFQPGVVTADGRLIPDPVADPAAPSGFGGGFSPQPLSAITDPNAAQVVAPSPLFQGADLASIQPVSAPELGDPSGSPSDDGADGDASADDPNGYRNLVDPRQTYGGVGLDPQFLTPSWADPRLNPMPMPPSRYIQIAAQGELDRQMLSPIGLDPDLRDALQILASADLCRQTR